MDDMQSDAAGVVDRLKRIMHQPSHGMMGSVRLFIRFTFTLELSSD